MWSVEGEGSTFTLRLPAREPGGGTRPSRPVIDLEEMPVTPGPSATRRGSRGTAGAAPAAAPTEGAA